MLFNDHAHLAKIVVEWCERRNTPVNPQSVIAALDTIGFFAEETVRKRQRLLMPDGAVLFIMQSDDGYWRVFGTAKRPDGKDANPRQSDAVADVLARYGIEWPYPESMCDMNLDDWSDSEKLDAEIVLEQRHIERTIKCCRAVMSSPNATPAHREKCEKMLASALVRKLELDGSKA